MGIKIIYTLQSGDTDVSVCMFIEWKLIKNCFQHKTDPLSSSLSVVDFLT